MYKTDNKLETVELVQKVVCEAKESKGPYEDNKDHKLFSKKEMELDRLRRQKRMGDWRNVNPIGGLNGGAPPTKLITDMAKKTMTDQQETRILQRKHIESDVKKSQLYTAKPHHELNSQWKELRKEGKGVPPAWTGFTIGKKNKTITPKEGLKISSLTEGKKTLWSGWSIMGRLVGGGAGPTKMSETRRKDKESGPVPEGPHEEVEIMDKAEAEEEEEDYNDTKEEEVEDEEVEVPAQPAQHVLQQEQEELIARNRRMDDHIANFTPIGERRPVARPVQEPVVRTHLVLSLLAR